MGLIHLQEIHPYRLPEPLRRPRHPGAHHADLPSLRRNPKGRQHRQLGVNEKGYFTHNGNAYFARDGYGESKVKELYWYGEHNSEYKTVNIYVKECIGC